MRPAVADRRRVPLAAPVQHGLSDDCQDQLCEALTPALKRRPEHMDDCRPLAPGDPETADAGVLRSILDLEAALRGVTAAEAGAAIERLFARSPAQLLSLAPVDFHAIVAAARASH
jgi:hypothetical protein